MKIKVYLNNNTIREFEIISVDIRPTPQLNGNHPTPVMLHLTGMSDKCRLSVTSNVIPDISFLDKIEISE
jgi:hypothetical protein